MVDDLLDTHRLIGLSADSIRDLLGEPDDSPRFYGLADKWKCVYRLGTERGGSQSLDDEFLVIRFDNSNHAIEATTVVN